MRKRQNDMYKIGSTQQKILILLFGGVALGLSGSSIRYYRTLRQMHRAWKDIDQRSFNRSIRSLCEKKLLEETVRADGTVRLTLTEDGRHYARYSDLYGSTIKIKRPKKWDGKWRLVIFDIPEKKRFFRDILRSHLKAIGFRMLQQSVFVFPYPCEKELIQLAELYNATDYVHVATVTFLDNEKALKEAFFKKKPTEKPTE